MKLHSDICPAFRRFSIIAFLALVPTSCFVSKAVVEHESGEVEHLASGLIFPEKLGAFQRVDHSQSDRWGFSVSIDYTRFHLVESRKAAFLVNPAIMYTEQDPQGLTPEENRKARLEQSVEWFKRVLLEPDADAKIVFEDYSIVMLQGKECGAFVANYVFPREFGEPTAEMFGTVSLIAVDDWLILFFLKAPNDSVARSTHEFSEFMQSFLEKNAGPAFEPGYGDE